ncbi:MAG: SRPBCC family protein [Proteobacteria bacterium]|nr:SRPBCC family protein [Pseudomonadota bacterium]
MTPIAMNVNGQRVEALVEPRTHLADFLREHCRLTGTHLGCEHGVCGACTVLIDGAPARSCIAFAVACDGFDIRTIEGFDDDAIMQQMREAFSREHGLQCGFCTPGMLIAARDLVLRLPAADERRIRVEMSGNLCRCTGYVGIVNAIRSVVEARRAPGETGAPEPPPATTPAAASFATFAPTPSAASAAAATAAPAATLAKQGWTRFEESFVVKRPPAEVWRIFADLPAVAACLPGTQLGEHDECTVRGKMTVKLGPIVAGFAGSATIERDEATMTGVIRGAGADSGTGTRTKGEVTYRLSPGDGGAATRVTVVAEYSLQGTLAQFSRSSIAQDLGKRLVGEFAANLNARLGAVGAAPPPAAPASLDAGRLLWAWLKDRLRRLVGR